MNTSYPEIIKSMIKAMSDVDLCWTARPTPSEPSEVLCRSSHPEASPDAINLVTMTSYVLLCRTKGIPQSELAAALRAKVDGDGTDHDAILATVEA